jgi:hypothetical protein
LFSSDATDLRTCLICCQLIKFLLPSSNYVNRFFFR